MIQHSVKRKGKEREGARIAQRLKFQINFFSRELVALLSLEHWRNAHGANPEEVGTWSRHRYCQSRSQTPPRTREERVWGHWRRFLVLQAQQSCDYLHRFLLAHVRSRDGAQDQENAPMSPDPFPRARLGSGNETKIL